MFDSDSIIHPRDRKSQDRSEVQELLSPGFKRRLEREKQSGPAKKKAPKKGGFGISVYVMPPPIPKHDRPKELDATALPNQTPSAEAKPR